jgi:1-acyl-sn-glycerol-3-phosphate acyltransferase
MAHNAGIFWPKGFWILPGTISVEIISVIYPQDIDGQDVRDVTDNIEKIINDRKTVLARQYLQ